MKIAFDRSARSVDIDGRLHVAVTNISKANICPYYGHEIPGSNELGLQPDRVYMLLRDPKELALAADSFNNIPLMSKHVRVSANKPEHDYVVGSTGTDAHFDGVYLKNSIVVWDQIAIDGIETKEQCELSCGYRYNADMTPGIFENVAYDGRMTNIIGNHVALVEVGRAGPDVVVGDENPFTTSEYKSMKHSRKAIAIRAALGVFLRPSLALDAAIVNVGALVRGVTSATLAQDSARIVKDVVAKIPDIDQKALTDVIRMAADAEPDDDDDTAEDAQQDGESDDDYKKRMGKDSANIPPAVKPPAVKPPVALDAATVRAETIAEMNAMRQAERDVLPLIGEVTGQTSAANVYKLALDAANINVVGVDPSAFGAMVKMLNDNKPAEKPPVVALDASTVDSFAARFPTAGKLKRV